MKAEHDDDELSVVSSSSYWNNAVQTSIRYIRPATPKLVPIAVCLGTIPLLIVLSIAAGWVVYSGIAVGWKSPLHLQYGDGRPPYAYTRLPTLSPSTPYDVSLVLSVPSIQRNLDLGNFMATMHLTNTKNSTIMHVRRSAIVLEPFPMFILFGKPRRLTEITVPLLTSFIPTTTSVNVLVEIGRQDNWNTLGSGEGRELSVYSAYIRGVVRPRGLRYLLSKFPITSAVVASATFFLLSMMTLLACIIPVVFGNTTNSPDGGEPSHETKGREIGSNRGMHERYDTKDEPDLSSDSSAVDISPAAEPSSSRRSRVKREPSPF